jgi:flagellar hook-length control protein FliK
MSKKEPKAKPKAKGKADDKPEASSELSEEQLQRVAGGASDIFAKLGDIKGESQDDKHKEQIEILSISPVKLPKRFT